MSLSSTNEHETSSSDTCVPPATFCILCDQIDLAANTDSLKKLEQCSPRKDAVGWVLGTLADILKKKTECQLCALVHFLVTKRIKEQGMETEVGFRVSLEWTINHFVKGQVVIAVVQVGEARWITLNDAFEPRHTVAGGATKIIPPPSVSPEIEIKRTLGLRHIEDKLKTCDAHHGRHCQRTSRGAEAVPIFLIDTHNLCLVQSNTESPYFTLSYRWGQTANAELTRGNIDALTRSGGLHEIWPKISRVVREAIQLVAQINIYAQRYLWVDSLCILQDDPEHKHSQIKHMGTIYHQAVMTIVALSAVNAESALLTYQEEDLQTQNALVDVEQQKQVRLVPDYRISMCLTTHADRPDYIYRSRGWTFQEEKLSRRVLYCTDTGMLFRCRVLLGNRPWWDDDWRDKSATEETLRTEAVRSWLDLVVDYSRRHFTYPSDTLRGFAGIADTLNHPVNGEMPLHVTCGPSLDWFPYSLCWRPRNFTAQKRHCSFPTWSWASCVGAVDFPGSSDVFSRNGHTAKLVDSPIPLEFGNNTPQIGGDGSSFDTQRSAIREHACNVHALDKSRKLDIRLPKQTTAIEVDKLFMLKMRVQLKVGKWSDLGLIVTKESIHRPFYEREYWPRQTDRPSAYQFLRKDRHVGYTDVSPDVFNASKKCAMAFIPLFGIYEFVFLVACSVGKDIYERLGIGWGCRLPAWGKERTSGSIVYLI